MIHRLIFSSLFFIGPLLSNAVSVRLEGQFGNQLFQIATAYAYALDHDLVLTVPDLVYKRKDNIPYNAKRLFLHKINSFPLEEPPLVIWKERHFNYKEIPPATSIELRGYFQSEKYFKHRRAEILELFKPPLELEMAILHKYPFLSSDRCTVGIQIRDYRKESPDGSFHPTLTRDYYEYAIQQFPLDSIFLVSSNNKTYAKSCMEGLCNHLIYLEGEDYIEEFYTLTFCRSFIISNSTFGWWAAWLSNKPYKTVLAPDIWFSPPFHNESMRKDLIPPEFSLVFQN